MTHTVPPAVGLRLAWAPVPTGTARRDCSRELLRTLIGADAASVSIVQRCPRCGGPHGPVQVVGAPVAASVTYAGDLAIAAVSDAAAGTLGIDAEPVVDHRRDRAGLAGVLGTGQSATVRGWTRVEAALKADGRGLRVDAAEVIVEEGTEGWTARLPARSGLVHGWDVEGPPGVVLSVAVARP